MHELSLESLNSSVYLCRSRAWIPCAETVIGNHDPGETDRADTFETMLHDRLVDHHELATFDIAKWVRVCFHE